MALESIQNSITVLIILHIVIIIIGIIIAVKVGKVKEAREDEIDYYKKLISEMQNITSRQQDVINSINDTNNEIFKNTQVVKNIEKNTVPTNAKDQEEIKKKLQEITQMMK